MCDVKYVVNRINEMIMYFISAEEAQRGSNQSVAQIAEQKKRGFMSGKAADIGWRKKIKPSFSMSPWKRQQ